VLPDSLRTRPRHIAFKTGTSYGHRDAWAIGYTTRFTVGVWVGRADGTPNPGRSGANTAAPLLFSVFDHLPPPSPPQVAQHARASTGAQFLPPALQRFERRAGGMAESRHAAGPRIVDPVDQAILPLPPGGRPLVIEAAGGVRPLRWIINDTEIPTRGAARRLQWRPDGPGFADIVVIDARGRRAGTHIRLVDELPTSATNLQKVAITDRHRRAAVASTGSPKDLSGR
jgi:penicillin-binding protein 1C